MFVEVVKRTWPQEWETLFSDLSGLQSHGVSYLLYINLITLSLIITLSNNIAGSQKLMPSKIHVILFNSFSSSPFYISLNNVGSLKLMLFREPLLKVLIHYATKI